MIIQIFISILFYLVIIYLSINLLGFLVRGLFSNPELDKLRLDGSDFIKDEVKKIQSTDKWINIIALILIIFYFYLLFYFWNIGVIVVAIMVMVGRLPDLLWEIKNDKKMTRAIAKSLPKNALFYVTTFLYWLGLPALYYFLYIFK